MKQIPSVDLRDFLSDDTNRRKDFIKHIGKAYEDIGFVALKGHFLDKDLVDELYTQVRDFFSLPYETKSKYEIQGLAGQRGCLDLDPRLTSGWPADPTGLAVGSLGRGLSALDLLLGSGRCWRLWIHRAHCLWPLHC